MTLTEALKKKDGKEVYAILTKAEEEWYAEIGSDAYVGYDNDKKHKFVAPWDSADKFDLEEWVCGLCINVLDEFIKSEGEKTGCDEALDPGCIQCCARHMAFALFLYNKFEDEYEDIIRELTVIDDAA